MFSWLSNQIDGYPDTISLMMYAQIQEPGSRPIFKLESTDHPLSQEHPHGIIAERVSEIMASRLEGEKRIVDCRLLITESATSSPTAGSATNRPSPQQSARTLLISTDHF